MNERQARMRPLAATLPAVTRAALGKRGFAIAALLADWPAIAGARLSGLCLPLRLVKGRGPEPDAGAAAGAGTETEGAVLELRVESAAAPEVQHLAPRIVERINAQFGYRAVSRLKLRHGPVDQMKGRAGETAVRAIRPPGAAEERALFRQLEGVEDESLRDALAGLGRAVITDRRS